MSFLKLKDLFTLIVRPRHLLPLSDKKGLLIEKRCGSASLLRRNATPTLTPTIAHNAKTLIAPTICNLIINTHLLTSQKLLKADPQLKSSMQITIKIWLIQSLLHTS